jgi:hypothetical protein
MPNICRYIYIFFNCLIVDHYFGYITKIGNNNNNNNNNKKMELLIMGFKKKFWNSIYFLLRIFHP